MRFLQHLVIAVAAVLVATRGLSTRPMVLRFHGHSRTGQNVQDNTSNDKIRIPSIKNNDNAFSSFVYNIPMRKKVHPLHLKSFPGNHGKRTVNLTGHANSTKFQMVGKPLSFQPSTKVTYNKDTRHEFKLVNDSSGTHGQYKGNRTFNHSSATGIAKTGKALMSFPESSISSSPKSNNKSGNESYAEDDHNDEFARESYSHRLSNSKTGHGQKKPATNAVKVNSPSFGKGRHKQPNDMLHLFLESIHNTTTASSSQVSKNPIEVQGNYLNDQLTNKSLDKEYFQNMMFTQDKNREQATNLKVSQNIVENLGVGSKEVIGGYGANEISNGRVLSPMGMSPTVLYTQEMTTSRRPLQGSEQSEASFNADYWGNPAREGQDSRTSYTNYHISNIINNYENKEENTERYHDDASVHRTYGLQRSENSNAEEDRGGYIAGYQYDDTFLPSPPSFHGYVPVDEFGSPFYSNETDDYFQREALMAHNRYRAVHNAPPLELDPQLSFEAAQLAALLARPESARNKVVMNNEGENVAKGCSELGGLTASGAVHRWYSKVCHYDWNKRGIQPKAKEFIQLVWKETQKIGIGRALATLHGLPCAFIVALYRPGKLNASDSTRNIGPGLFSPTYCNADVDDNLLSTGYPSNFFARTPQSGTPNLSQKDDESPQGFKSMKGFKVAAEDTSGVTYVPLTSFERDVDEQDMEDALNEQPDIKAPSRFLPHVSYVQTPDNYVAMEVDDIGVKRAFKTSKALKPNY